MSNGAQFKVCVESIPDDFVSLHDSDCGKSGAGSDRFKPAVWSRQSNWIVRASQVDRQALYSFRSWSCECPCVSRR